MTDSVDKLVAQVTQRWRLKRFLTILVSAVLLSASVVAYYVLKPREPILYPEPVQVGVPVRVGDVVEMEDCSTVAGFFDEQCMLRNHERAVSFFSNPDSELLYRFKRGAEVRAMSDRWGSESPVMARYDAGPSKAVSSCQYLPWLGPAYGLMASKSYFREKGRNADASDLGGDSFLASLAIFDHVRRRDFGFLDDEQTIERLVALDEPPIHDGLVIALIERNDGELPVEQMGTSRWGKALLAWRESVIQEDNVRGLFQRLRTPVSGNALSVRESIVKNYTADNPEVVSIAAQDLRNHGFEEDAMNGWLAAASFAHALSFQAMARSPSMSRPDCQARREVFLNLYVALIGG